MNRKGEVHKTTM